jgi:feruloyl esterase
VLAATAAAVTPTKVYAALEGCTAANLQALAPEGMKIAGVTNLNARLPASPQGVAQLPAGTLGAGTPELCLVSGTVVTNPASGKTANFGALLPDKSAWNSKFMFSGCGGNCGMVFTAPPTAHILGRGYAVWATDDGHIAARNALQGGAFAVSSAGHPDEDALTDFYYRATHAVILAGKRLTAAYYQGVDIAHSYFMGCSDGGRDAMVELSRFPADFDGVIAGDPYFKISGQVLSGSSGIAAQLRSRRAAIGPELFKLAEGIINAGCDSLDGVSDGLIQNPQLCRFNPQTDLPRCRDDSAGPTCFTQDQVDSLSVMLSAVTDERGHVLQPGYPVSDIGGPLALWEKFPTPPQDPGAAEPWGDDPAQQPLGWQIGDGDARYFVFADEPGYGALRMLRYEFRQGSGTIPGFHALMPAQVYRKIEDAVAPGSAYDAGAAHAFLAGKHKLILYHGLSDGLITPYISIAYFEKLAALEGGYERLGQDARLFLVPGMFHCAGGPGPNNFGQASVPPADSDASHDALMALEQWVEHGIAPGQLVATKFTDDSPTQPVLRTMPLCPFPAQARYKGNGDVNRAENWYCPRRDRSALHGGPDGREAGLVP